jgi:hypothetical protein
MQSLAHSKGGICLSTRYINSTTKLKWCCKEGHEWKAMPSSIKVGQWCPMCARKQSGSSQRLSIGKMREIAKKNGGECLSEKYFNSKTKLKWRCVKGHVWETPYVSISMGHWCPICSTKISADKRRMCIEDMQRLAEQRGGKCLSKIYIDNRHKLEWLCSKGHTWKAPYNKIYTGRWCPICGGTSKLSIEEIQSIAEKHGGKCLSDKYVDNRTKLRFQCRRGHIWEASAHSIRANHWCPKCSAQTRSEKRKHSIQDMQKLAEKRSGKCLSTEYVNNKTKLRWQCKEGHNWEARPDDITNGHWCPICARSKK